MPKSIEEAIDNYERFLEQLGRKQFQTEKMQTRTEGQEKGQKEARKKVAQNMLN